MNESPLPSPRTVARWVLRRAPDLVAIAVVVLVAGELYLRSHLGRQHDYAPDADLGAVLRPGQDAACGRVNTDGHRGPDTDWSRPVVLAVGDSQAFGMGVRDDEVWTSRLAERVAGVQVVNAAHPGFGPHHQAVRLRRLLERDADVRAVLVRVSIEDRNFLPPPAASIPVIHAGLESSARVREWSRLLPFLKIRAEQQWGSLASLVAPSPGEATRPGDPAVGRAMWEQHGAAWRQMIEAAARRAVPLVFFVHDPTNLSSNQVLETKLAGLAGGRNVTVVRLGAEAWGLDGIDPDRLWRQYHARYTLQHDHHGNAAHHELVARRLEPLVARVAGRDAPADGRSPVVSQSTR